MDNSESQISNKIGRGIKYGNIGIGIYTLIRDISGFIIVTLILVFFMTRGLPLYMGLPIILFAVALFILELLRLRKAAMVSLEPLSGLPSVKIDFSPNEKILTTFSGIMRIGFYLRNSITFIDTPQIKRPENAMIVTDKRILFLYVPLAGADKMMGADIGMWDWMLAKKDIKSRLDGMIFNFSLLEIYSSHPKNFALNFEDLTKVSFSNFQRRINFYSSDHKKCSYSFRDKADFERAKQVFANFIK